MTIAYLLFFLICFLVISYLISEYIKKKEKKIPKAEFIADCYKLQQKWASKGEFQYAKGIGLVIESFSIDDQPTTAITDYGKQVAKQMEMLTMQKAADLLAQEDI